MNSFKLFMEEEKIVNRWFILKVGIFGAFMGSLLTVSYIISSMGIWF